jgi:hypothetical protein
LLSPWFKLQRELHLDKVHLPVGFTVRQFFLSLILPGYAFFVNGRRTLGRAFVGIYILSTALFIVALGYQLGSLGYGLMVSAHASSVVFLEGYWLRSQVRLVLRLALAIITLLVVWQAVYSPITSYVNAHLIMPLRVRGNIVIFQRLTTPSHIQRGDWIMYSIRSIPTHGLILQDGFGWGPVLAEAGDAVVFSTNSFSVNGVEHPRLPHMPVKGGLVVSEKHWFVWPELAIRQGNVSEEFLSALLLQLATVSEAEFVGKPFKHWFLRKQQIHEPVRQS